MTTDNGTVFAAAIRQHFDLFLRLAYRELGGEGDYQHNWHIEAIAHQLDRVRRQENRRLMVTMPPRHLKSVTISIAWIAWMLGNNPALKFLCVSYGQDLADDHAESCLRIMRSHWYRRAFPSLVLTKRAVADFHTSAGGGRLSTSIDGVTTGFGSDIIIIDDPMKAQDISSEAARTKLETWIDATLMQRLNSQDTGAIILVMQRLHEGDLVGVLKGRGNWHELRLPAIADCDEEIPVSDKLTYKRRAGHALHPARQSLETLLERRQANPFVFASQFQQEPVPLFGNLIEAHWLMSFDPAALATAKKQIIQSWDTASKDNPFNDYSVCVTAWVIDQTIYIVDVFRKRMKFPELVATANRLAQHHRADVILIEDASSGQQLLQTMQKEKVKGIPLPFACKPEGDKISRVQGASESIANGRVFIPSTAPWLADFTAELLAAPAGKHDDQVDALAQLVLWVRDRYRKASFAVPIIVTAPRRMGPW